MELINGASDRAGAEVISLGCSIRCSSLDRARGTQERDRLDAPRLTERLIMKGPDTKQNLMHNTNSLGGPWEVAVGATAASLNFPTIVCWRASPHW